MNEVADMNESQATTAEHINFDHWSALAKSDPDCFEQLRSKALDACIARASDAHQIRLRQLQWRIDRIREQSSNPLAACVKISDMMWNTFHQLERAYKHLEVSPQQKSANPLPCAKILPFHPTH